MSNAEQAPTFERVVAAVQARGLQPRGAFEVGPSDAVPPIDHRPAQTLVLVGNAGPSMWEAFAESGYLDGRSDPLDGWSRDAVEALAEAFGARALFPFGGPPFHPFIRWAQRAETVWPSVMGPLIHPRYGLWHAYRGALAFAEALILPQREDSGGSPCEGCVDPPCLRGCPVEAIALGHYDVPTCVSFLTDPGRAGSAAECLQRGCQARRACPVGAEYHYHPDQAQHHMGEFVRSAGRGSDSDER